MTTSMMTLDDPERLFQHIEEINREMSGKIYASANFNHVED